MWHWDHDPFGNGAPRSAEGFRFDLRFPGQFHDAETGLSYNYFRDYDPKTGRYIESDPIGLRGGINTYAYVGGRPLTKIDRYGWQSLPPFIGPIKSGPAPENLNLYRYFGGSSPMLGRFLTPNFYSSPESAIQNLALPQGATAENVCRVQVPEGTQIEYGRVAPNFNQPGGGFQIRLLEDIPSSSYEPLGPTELVEPEGLPEFVPLEFFDIL